MSIFFACRRYYDRYQVFPHRKIAWKYSVLALWAKRWTSGTRACVVHYNTKSTTTPNKCGSGWRQSIFFRTRSKIFGRLLPDRGSTKRERERLQKLVGECQESRSKKSKKGYSKVPRLFIGVFRRCWHYVEHEGRRPKQESKTLCKTSSTMRSMVHMNNVYYNSIFSIYKFHPLWLLNLLASGLIM